MANTRWRRRNFSDHRNRRSGALRGHEAEPSAAGDSCKHVILEQASLADAGPFMKMATNIGAIRALMEDQVPLQEDRQAKQEQDKIKERLDKADIDRQHMLEMMEEPPRNGAEQKPGRRLRDAVIEQA